MAKTFEYEIVTLWPSRYASDVANHLSINADKVQLLYHEILVLDQKGREGFEHYMTLSETELVPLNLPEGKKGFGFTEIPVKKLYFKKAVNGL